MPDPSIEPEQNANFSKEEREALRQMARAYQVWQVMGILGRIAMWILLSVAGALVAWDQIRVSIGKWFHG
jgi:hypothetical protein